MQSERPKLKIQDFPLFFGLALCGLALLSCAKRPAAVTIFEMPKVSDIKAFKGIAYIVAEKGGLKWASSASVLVKEGGLLRMDAIENITDVTATVSAGKKKGYLHLPLEDRWVPFENGLIKLPFIGDIPVSAPLLGTLLIGRPPRVEGADIEIDPKEGLPALWTMFSYDGAGRKKGVVLEASFGEYSDCHPRWSPRKRGLPPKDLIGGGDDRPCKRFPMHVMIRFERPKLLMDIRYKEIWPDANVPDALFEIGPRED